MRGSTKLVSIGGFVRHSYRCGLVVVAFGSLLWFPMQHIGLVGLIVFQACVDDALLSVPECCTTSLQCLLALIWLPILQELIALLLQS